jgi:Cu2+-exporting ATPase
MPVRASVGAESIVSLADEGGLLAAFSIADELRADAQASLRALDRLGHRLSIASGDTEGAVQNVARTLAIADWRAALNPADKLALAKLLKEDGLPVVMVGDGVNDAPVLAAADASIAIDAGTALARASADAVIPGRRLDSIVLLAKMATRSRQIIRQNIGWAIVYNLAAVPLAVSGVLLPWMAALGMSLSSLLVVGNALRLHRVETGPAGSVAVVAAAAKVREAAV